MPPPTLDLLDVMLECGVGMAAPIDSEILA